MGVFSNIVLVLVTLVFAWIAYSVNVFLQPPTLPDPLPETWWGPGSPKPVDTAIKPFKINIPDTVLTDLRSRLDSDLRLIPSMEDSQFNYGINSETVKQIVQFWKTKYNWREREVFLNQFPQFKTNIQGLDVHYLHIKPKVKSTIKVLPLLLLHGWPGSVREFYEMIPMLTTPRTGVDFVFEVIAPSLPGYGFSQAASKKGLGSPQMAVVMKNLMKRIGFERFYVQGGDWGAGIASNMATMMPENVIGVHSNMCFTQSTMSFLLTAIGAYIPNFVVDEKYAHRMYPLSEKYMFILQEMGYMHLQATKPDTVGVALSNSPVGLAAYILEKFSTWTDPAMMQLADGGLTKKFTHTQLLDNVMIYWVTNSITSSMRLYSETMNKATSKLQLDAVPTDVPYACARFAHELAYASDKILKLKFRNLVHSSDLERGGHFAAFEEPKLLADDLFSAVQTMKSLQIEKKV